MGQGVGGAAGGDRGFAQAVACSGLAVPLAGLLEEGEGLSVEPGGPVG
ncbi:hypothetical protein GCM10007977_101080 [Dactylosporangium sucinum]|uniref:Uncharacterized protein n=1 Tax=Dactylosporangium sucinum TaxID=1424081 RepID=A0A917UD13_9ACTN|nr:hypothetical protein [Dactylosporangium sucinum]GGM83500.1 hypothetical protein GCM10007977_101080 [Dactylosporangium sucinum]